jgi:hypothetical protein
MAVELNIQSDFSTIVDDTNIPTVRRRTLTASRCKRCGYITAKPCLVCQTRDHLDRVGCRAALLLWTKKIRPGRPTTDS